MLSVQNLSLTRGDNLLVDGLSLSVGAGEILHVRGANGRGKTTLLRALAGLVLPEDGSVTWHGRPVRGPSDNGFREAMLFLGHRPALKPALTPVENLAHYRALRGAGGEDVRPALDAFGIGHVADRPCATLSAGQQRRACLARLLAEQAEIWILDEPFTALDQRGVDDLGGMIDAYARTGGTVIITSHQSLPVTDAEVRALQLGTEG